MKWFATGLAAVSFFILVSCVQAAETYIRFGEGYLVGLSKNRLAIGNSIGVNVTAGYQFSKKTALEGDYINYRQGPSAGFVSLNFSRPDGAWRPRLNMGLGAIDHKLLGFGIAGKVGAGLSYFYQPISSPEIAIGFETSLIKGTGGVGSFLYLNNALMFALHF
ncbi:MAG: hypothetical protein HZB99_03390 [Candidatus Harrisonbacteria bacterium]|nr:hypothetical protein [Candidatus Harrisonbacteria bacterium]